LYFSGLDLWDAAGVRESLDFCTNIQLSAQRFCMEPLNLRAVFDP
jgi:hypothetical protein